MKFPIAPIAALTLSLVVGCHWNSHAYMEQQRRDGQGTDAQDGSHGTVTQAGAPSELATPVDPSSGEPQKEEKKLSRRERKERERAARAARAAEEMEAREALASWKLDQKHIDILLRDGGGDDHMIGMFLMVNDIDLNYAKLALAHTESADVRAFAKRIITDHTQMIASLNTLAAGRDFAPADNRLGRDLRDRATIQRDSLRELAAPAAFDSAYVATELSSHKQLLSMIDDVLLPRAQDGELREIIAGMRPIISAHLAHAEDLQAAIAKR